MRYRSDKPRGWAWPVEPQRNPPPPAQPCEECGSTHGLHLIDCPVLTRAAELLKDTEWGQGVLMMNDLLNDA